MRTADLVGIRTAVDYCKQTVHRKVETETGNQMVALESRTETEKNSADCRSFADLDD